jgi:hypothetical protein
MNHSGSNIPALPIFFGNKSALELDISADWGSTSQRRRPLLTKLREPVVLITGGNDGLSAPAQSSQISAAVIPVYGREL